MPIAICENIYGRNELGENNNDRISVYLETCRRENKSSLSGSVRTIKSAPGLFLF